jgi:hypothetical protein
MICGKGSQSILDLGPHSPFPMTQEQQGYTRGQSIDRPNIANRFTYIKSAQ